MMQFLVVLLLSGSLFYHFIEKWPYLDALYYSVMTLATVGSATIEPITIVGRLFTILYVFVGVGVMLTFITAFSSHARSENSLDNNIFIDSVKKTKDVLGIGQKEE
jgi:predicted membrane protein